MKALAIGIVIAAFILGVSYTDGEKEKANAIVMTKCIDSGGTFYISWNWKPVCELKVQKKPWER